MIEGINVFGEPLVECSKDPLTGFYRNGCCDTGADDDSSHTVCAIMTDEFLIYSKNNGNDLITPRPEFKFKGLVKADRWCLCAGRWMEAYKDGVAPSLILEATHEATLKSIKMEDLIKYAHVNKFV